MASSYQFENRGLYFRDADGAIHLGQQLIVDEKLSSPFLIQGRLISNNFSADEQLGQPITCQWNEVVDNKQKQKRIFNGYLTEVQQLESKSEQGHQHYKITLRPWFWLLTLRTNYRVFQQKTLSDILSSVFNDAGFSGSYSLGTLPSDERSYCVQYNETDFDFVQRLLSEQGIHYYFTHTSSGHQLNMHDPNSPYEKASIAKLDYHVARSGQEALLTKWQPKLNLHACAISTANYDYQTSQVIKSEDKASSHAIANSKKLTHYQFGANSVKGDMSDLSSTIANTRLNQIQSDYSLVEAASSVEELSLATQFSLSSHPESEQLGNYAIEAIQHVIEAAEQGIQYHNDFICRASSQLSFPRFLSKPIINGLQTAIVIGGDIGQPQHDSNGRIKVQFHWDTVGGENSSCWIRVAQSMASAGLGLQFIPRVGDEVLVSFVNNDPDQPVIIGSVYNSKNLPPYDQLNSTQSGIKTQLGKQANELRFDDKTDNEELYLHAAKDLVLAVENNFTETITAEFSSTTEKAIAITGKDNYSLKITEKLTEDAKEIALTATDKMTFKVGDNSIELSKDGITINCKELTIDSSGDINLDGANIKLNSKADTTISAKGSFSASATANAELSGKAGVTVSTSAQAKVSGDAGAELSSSAMTKVSSSGIAQISGSLVQIN